MRPISVDERRKHRLTRLWLGDCFSFDLGEKTENNPINRNETEDDA